MNREERIEKLVREVFKLNQSKIDKDWTSDNIPNWDSMGHLSLVVALEKEFNIKFEIEEIFQIQKVGDISKILEKKLDK